MIKRQLAILTLIVSLTGVSTDLFATPYTVKVRNNTGSYYDRKSLMIFALCCEASGSIDVLAEDDTINVTLPFGNYIEDEQDGPQVIVGKMSDTLIRSRIHQLTKSFPERIFKQMLQREVPGPKFLLATCANLLSYADVVGDPIPLPDPSDQLDIEEQKK